MFIILTLIFVSLFVLYVKHKYFTSRRSIPSLPGHFLFGNLLQSGLLRGVSLPQVYASFKNKLGDIYEIKLGFLHGIIVGNIDDVKYIFTHRHIYDQSDWSVELLGALIPDGLITLKGAKFKRHASIVMPLFRHGKILSNFDLIINYTDEILNNWRSSSSDHIHCDILQQFTGLIRREILGEMLMFLAASFETTSTVLAWSIHLLSKHPEVQQKIKAELMKENVHRDLILDRLDSLIYLDCVIKEILRFSPTIDATARTLTMDDRLPNSGIQLYKGDQILIPVCILSKDPRYWSIDPELFYPERFLGEDTNHNPYAFLPFGSGHRQCIGQDLARFELKVIIARLMQHVTFIDGGPEVNAGGQVQGLTVMPKYIGVKIKFDSEI
ncbi:unnamed protein product [Rotaria sordida]|uniref:Cytochrome P450 n=1 Tax=Rotaria sordida TaxID=392033 RepID=A0A819DJR1_9BILA|nr:unnamed protein product [Rotaria sordida]